MSELQAFKQNTEHGHAGLGPKFDVVCPQCPIDSVCAKAIISDGQETRLNCCEHLSLPIKKSGDGYLVTCNKLAGNCETFCHVDERCKCGAKTCVCEMNKMLESIGDK